MSFIAGKQQEREAVLRAQAIMRERKKAGTWSGRLRAHSDYAHDPLGWIVKHLHVPEHTIRWSLNPGYEHWDWDGDADPLYLVLTSLADGHDVGVESATGTGKTFLAACILYWFLAVFEDSIVITGAPKEDQLLLHIWKEVGRLFPRFKAHFPQAVYTTGKLRMKPQQEDRESWAATAFVCGVGADEEIAQRAAGFHAEHQLWITEETPGISPAIMATIGETRTDDHNLHLALGNPDHRNDPLHRFCFNEKEKAQPNVKHVRISAFDHPNVVTGERIVPGAIGRMRLKARIAKLGEGSRLFQSRIRGISPAQAAEALIRWEWCVAAGERYNDPTYRKGALGLGADVAASENGDKGAIARGQGACLTEVEAFACPDPNELGARIVREAQDPHNPIDPRYIGVDPVGVGAGTVNEIRRLGMRVRWLSGGTRAVPGLDVDTLWSEVEPDLEGRLRATGPTVVEAERFDNLRSQIWWRMREDLRLGRVALPQDPELWQDLCTPEWQSKNGKICVEPKETIVTRLKRSPNKGDAACYWNFVRRRIPMKLSVRQPIKAGPNRDVGLERRLARIQRQQKADEKKVQRHLRRAKRLIAKHRGREL